VRVKSSGLYVSVMVLILLTLMWALPASAAPALQTAGTMSTDVSVVSPDGTLGGSLREVTVTVVDTDLTITEFVGAGPNSESATYDAVVITTDADGLSAFENTVVQLEAGTFDGSAALLVQAQIDSSLQATVLPIVDRDGNGSVTVADVQLLDVAGAATSDLIIVQLGSATAGTILLQSVVDIAAGTSFQLRYATSPQETTIVSVAGDAGTFDLALLESSDPNSAGTYAGSFLAADEVAVDIGSIVDEQHSVAGGLSTNVAHTNESHDVPALNDAAGACCALGDTFSIIVDNYPIKDGSDDGSTVTTADVSADGTGIQTVPSAITNATTGVIQLLALGALTPGDGFNVDYNGPEDFTVVLGHAPITAPTDVLFPVATNVSIPTGNVENPEDLYIVYESSRIAGTIRFGVLKDTPAAGSFMNITYSGSEAITIPDDLALNATFTLPLGFQLDPSAVAGDIDPVNLATGGAGIDTTSKVSVTSIDFNANTIDLTATGSMSAGDVLGFSYPYLEDYNALNSEDPAEASRPTTLVGNGGSITITYQDADPDRSVSSVVVAEADAPTFSGASPADDASTSGSVTFSIDVTDLEAGVDTDSIRFVMFDDTYATYSAAMAYGALNAADVAARTFGDDSDETITFTTSGDTVTASAVMADMDSELGANFDVGSDTDVAWWVVGSDDASNSDITDSDSTVAGDQGYILSVDAVAPNVVSAKTGDHWNDTSDVLEGDRRLGINNFLAGAADSSSIRVEYNEALDGTTVDANDYTVAGHSLQGATHYADDPTSVYLTVVGQLGPSETPSVTQTGSVSDTAGNTLTAAAAVTASDGIAPTPTVTLSASVSTGSVVITVATNEVPRVRPTLTALLANSTSAGTPTITRPTTTTNVYSFSGVSAGQYNVLVSVEDANRNKTSAGNADPTNSSAITFEIDTALPAADATNPDGSADVSVDDPFFIEITWTGEGSEYTGDGQSAVTLTKATLDGVDVLGQSSTRDNRNFTIAIVQADFLADSGASDFLGAHKLVYNAEDGLGNTLSSDAELSFTVVERPTWALGLTPGLNLVSLPGQPAVGDINTVFGPTEAINLVFTFGSEHSQIASRDPETGNFVGSLETIDPRHAYFVRATATAEVAIDIPSLKAESGLPFIRVVGDEWNLVPVISLEELESIPQNTEVDADDYLGKFVTAFTFEANRWIKITPGSNPQCVASAPAGAVSAGLTGSCGRSSVNELAVGVDLDGVGGTVDTNVYVDFDTVTPDSLNDSVQIGRGYWVWYNSDDTLRP
jgi:hypothetical protein